MAFMSIGILRLVRFNVKTAEAKGNAEAIAAQKKHFTGLPIPGSALAAVSANLLLSSPFLEKFFDLSQETKAIVLSSIMIILG